MAKENKLQIRIEARAEQFQQALKKVEADVKKSTSTISDSFKKSGDGVEALVSTIDLVEQAFDESGDAGKKALEVLSDKSSEAGKDLRDAFVKGGQSIEDAEKEAKNFVKAIEQFSDAKQEADKLEESLKGIKDELDKTGDAAKAINFQTALDSARDLAEGLKNISSSFTSTAEESRNMERAIKAAIAKPEQAKEMIAAAKAIKDEYGDLVSEEDIGQAVKRLDTLQAATRENLQAVAKLATDSGKDLESAADDLGEILAPIGSGITDLDLLGESFRANFGVGVEVLRKYGAEIDSNGKIVAGTREEQQKAQDAVRRYLNEAERFKGIADRNKDSQAKLTDEYEKFQRSVGEAINELKNFAAEVLLPLVRSFNELSPGIKKTIAGAIVLAPAIASVAVAGTQAVTAFNFIKTSSLGAAVANSRLAGAAGTAATSMSGAATAAAALNVGVLGFAGVAAAALVAIVAIKNATDGWIESLEQADEANSKLIDTETRFIQK
ncbi:MAG: hypothetical protein KC800_02975, partial [Candidatus Eremiobacteraeota bacterium]|nr:hypothetical protein [Candidatus Eremiobacteraeota bacterium]